MEWIKRGQILKADKQFDWMYCYMTPVAAVVLSDKIRIFFSSRSKSDLSGNFISYASYLDLDIQDPKHILYIHDKPIIELGEPGCFDEYGTMVAKPVKIGNTIYLYYMGWQRLGGKTAPYQVALGLMISDDLGNSFRKVSKGPVIGIDLIDPISIGNVSVIYEDGIFKMWYTTFTKWEFGGVKPTPEYNIKYAISNDGIKWEKTNIVCIEEDINGGVATPSVIKFKNKYHMWFGYRPPYDIKGKVHGYRIGYAWSSDGKFWNRDDKNSGIDISNSGWDSEMVCYPHIIESENRFIMFFCGNGFGRDGFGYAESDNNLNEVG